MRSREMVFESSCLPLWNIFFPPSKTQEKSEDIKKKKNLIVSNVVENKKILKGGQRFNGVEVVSIVT